MNWRRGLFRLWIVGAAIFAIAVSCISYGDIKAEFDGVASKPKTGQLSTLAEFRQRYPQYNNLNDAQLADALYKKFYSDMPRDQFDKKIAAPKTKIVEFHGQWHEFPADMTAAEIAEALATLPPGFVLDRPSDPAMERSPWASVGRVASIAFGIPLVVLIVGASFVWAFSGFAAARP